LTQAGEDAAPRIWALLGAHVGDNNQVIALAEALGLPFEIKQLEYNQLRHLGPRLLGASLASLTKASRQAIASDVPPHITISSGHRSVAVARALRRRSGGSTRSIHVGFPRIAPGHFDLVIATPQYPIPDHANVLRTTYALTRAGTSVPDADDEAQLVPVSHPRALLIIGGPSLYWTVNSSRTLGTIAAMLDEAQAKGGSIMVTTSPRTPRRLKAKIAQILRTADVPTVLAEPGGTPTYAALLKSSDSIRITADSVSMVSDAIWTGKPVGLVPVRKSLLGWLMMGIMDMLRPRRPVYPQDLRSFWNALKAVGISQDLATPNLSTSDELRTIIDRVRPIVARGLPPDTNP